MLSGYMIKWFRLHMVKAMTDFEKRVELACAIDKARFDRAMGTKGEVILMTEQQLKEISPSVALFVRTHNDRVLNEERKCQPQQTR